MRSTSRNNYFYLNREGRWPGFIWSGLELRADGALTLSSVPLLSSALPDEVVTAVSSTLPGGMAIDGSGTIYFSDPGSNRISGIDGCDSKVGHLPCIGGTSGLPSRLCRPRGLLVPQKHSALFVADSGNHRIQIFDLNTFQLLDIWGQPNPGGIPQPGDEPGRFKEPTSLAGDASGNVYVVDFGNRRVQKFDPAGDVIPAFSDNVQTYSALGDPIELTVCEHDGVIRIFVLDIVSRKIFIFDEEGFPVADANGISDPHLRRPMGLAATDDTLYVGDNLARRVLRFQIHDFAFSGEAIGYQGPVSALLLDGKDGLWVHAGGPLLPIRLEAGGGFRSQGSLWSDIPIRVQDRKVDWYRLSALTETLNREAHVELFIHTSDDPAEKPSVDPNAVNPFADPKWRPVRTAAQVDLSDLYIDGPATKYLWCGALLSGEGRATPVLYQLRIEFDQPSDSQYLPAIYRNEADCDEFLERVLSLFESIFKDVEQEIGSLPKLFDPAVTPKRFLPWLAGVLGLELDENWSEEKQRRIIADIFRIYGRRGTPAGLREFLRLFANVDGVIEEPLLHSGWWALPAASETCCEQCGSGSAPTDTTWEATENSILGATTMLASAQPQGAVVGTSAILDQSSLITVDEFGSPLFSDTAWQFSVQVYRGQLNCAETLSRLRAILDQEKPAHTSYHLCIVEPRMRVGFQSRVGVDTVIGGQGRSLTLGTDQILGEGTLLAGNPSSRIGIQNQLGVTTHLT